MAKNRRWDGIITLMTKAMEITGLDTVITATEAKDVLAGFSVSDELSSWAEKSVAVCLP